MNVLNTSQIRAADQYTIEHDAISSIELMEQASVAFVEKFTELIVEKKPILIFSGVGNNGGDGLAIGRILIDKGWTVSFFIAGSIEKGSPDFKANLKRISSHKQLESSKDFPKIDGGSIIIDGLFGSGISRPIEGLANELISYLNSQDANRVSIDIASGLLADQALSKDSVVFKPHLTISFQVPKLAFFLPDCHEYVGEWEVVDIGLNKLFISDQTSDYYFSQPQEMIELLPERLKFSHKSQIGKLLVVAGSKGKMGAAALCAQAALRAGVGLINVQTPKCGTMILQILVPEAMVIEDQAEEILSRIDATDSFVAIGPGIGTAPKTQEAVSDFIKKSKRPLVLDADLLNILSLKRDLIDDVPAESILTPHPGEFKRLVGNWNNDFERLEMLQSFCKKYKINVVLKGAFSSVCNSNGQVFFNSSGNPGMATAGSGDVLTGIVASYLAQNVPPFKALKLGVYVHGLAGDFAAKDVGENSLTASDIIFNISNAIDHLCV